MNIDNKFNGDFIGFQITIVDGNKDIIEAYEISLYNLGFFTFIICWTVSRLLGLITVTKDSHSVLFSIINLVTSVKSTYYISVEILILPILHIISNKDFTVMHFLSEISSVK